MDSVLTLLFGAIYIPFLTTFTGTGIFALVLGYIIGIVVAVSVKSYLTDDIN